MSFEDILAMLSLGFGIAGIVLSIYYFLDKGDSDVR
jgi:hypothetical protein